MTNSRAEILDRIHTALRRDAEASTAVDASIIPRHYRRVSTRPRDEVLDQFVAYVEEYRANVQRITSGDVEQTLRSLVGDKSCIVPDDLPAVLGIELPTHWVRDRGQTSVAQIENIEVVVTAAAVGIAATGTIVLDGGAGQGRRILSLLPDHHVCVVRASQVVELVPEAIDRLEPIRVQTWISGPSATSDIELDRVEGVHGPRRLDVLLLADS